MVTFRLFAAARAAAGSAEVRVPAGTVREAVAALVGAGPDRLGQVVGISSLVHEGRRLDPASGDTLPDGAIVDVLPPFAGG
jgi:molybdopterin converting factor small subunit